MWWAFEVSWGSNQLIFRRGVAGTQEDTMRLWHRLVQLL